MAAELRSGKLFFVYKVGSKKDELTVLSSVSSLFDSKWHHLVFVRSHEDGALYAYLDGALVGTKACTRDFMNLKCGISFGNSQEPDSYDEPFAGSMDEIKVFHGALSQTEVSNLYKSGTTTGAAPSAIRLTARLVGQACVYPTSVFNSFCVLLPEGTGYANITLHDMSGAVRFATSSTTTDRRIEVGGFAGLVPPGLYVVKVTTSISTTSTLISIK